VTLRKPTRVLIEVIGGDTDSESDLPSNTAVRTADNPSQQDDGHHSDRHSSSKDTAEPADDSTELIECVLNLLAGILGMGQWVRSDEEEGLIRQMLAPLQEIAFSTDGQDATGKPLYTWLPWLTVFLAFVLEKILRDVV
jgi:hypothetical protein